MPFLLLETPPPLSATGPAERKWAHLHERHRPGRPGENGAATPFPARSPVKVHDMAMRGPVFPAAGVVVGRHVVRGAAHHPEHLSSPGSEKAPQQDHCQ